MARTAVDRAIEALWAFHERPSPTGIRWSDIDGCDTLDHYRAELERMPGNFMEACQAFLPAFDGLTHEEARAVASVLEMADALRLSPVRSYRLPVPAGDSADDALARGIEDAAPDREAELATCDDG